MASASEAAPFWRDQNSGQEEDDNYEEEDNNDVDYGDEIEEYHENNNDDEIVIYYTNNNDDDQMDNDFDEQEEEEEEEEASAALHHSGTVHGRYFGGGTGTSTNHFSQLDYRNEALPVRIFGGAIGSSQLDVGLGSGIVNVDDDEREARIDRGNPQNLGGTWSELVADSISRRRAALGLTEDEGQTQIDNPQPTVDELQRLNDNPRSAAVSEVDVSALKPEVLPDPEQDYRKNTPEDEEELKAFQCAICHDVMTYPSGCGSCAGRFCSTCLSQQLFSADTCPTCRVSMYPQGIVLDTHLKAQMDVAMFPCRHAACPLQIFASNIEHHERLFCQGVRVACKYAALGCIWKGTRAEYNQGHEYECCIAGNPGLLAYIETTQQHAKTLQERLRSIEDDHQRFEDFAMGQMRLIYERADEDGERICRHAARMEQYVAESQYIYSRRNPFHILWLVLCSSVLPSYVIKRHENEFATLTRENALGRAIAHNCLVLLPTFLLATKLFYRGLAFMLWEFRVHHLSMAYCWISNRVQAANLLEPEGISHLLSSVRALLFNTSGVFAAAEATTNTATFEAGTCAASYPLSGYDYPLLTSTWDRLQVLAIPFVGYYIYRGFMRDPSSPGFWSAFRILETGRSDLPIRYDGKSVVTASLVIFYAIAIQLIKSMNGHDHDNGGATFEHGPGFKGSPVFTLSCVLVSSLCFPSILMFFWFCLEVPVFDNPSTVFQCETSYLLSFLKMGGNANGPMMLALAFCVPILVTSSFAISGDALVFLWRSRDAVFWTRLPFKSSHQFWTESPNVSPSSFDILEEVWIYGMMWRILYYCRQVVMSLWTNGFETKRFGECVVSSVIDLGWSLGKAVAFRLGVLAVVILFMGGIHWAYFRFAYLGNLLFKFGSEQFDRDDFYRSLMGPLGLIIWTTALYQIATV